VRQCGLFCTSHSCLNLACCAQHFRLFVPPTELRRQIELDRREEAFFVRTTGLATHTSLARTVSGPPTRTAAARRRSMLADYAGLFAGTPRPLAAATPRGSMPNAPSGAATPKTAIVRVAKAAVPG
jgi:hypothetical protein